MPLGLVLGADGRITGTPTETVGRTFIVRAVDALGRSTFKTFNISIQNPLDITTTVLPEAAVKESYNFCMSSTNGVTSNTWSVVGGTMPPGVTMQTNGCFTNPPTALGTFNPQVQVTDLASPPQVVTRNFTHSRVCEGSGQRRIADAPAITWGGPGGRRLAQTVTVGANGALSGFGLLDYSYFGPRHIEVQRLDDQGRPDRRDDRLRCRDLGLQRYAPDSLRSRSASAIDSCSSLSSTHGVHDQLTSAVTDTYQAGDALVDSGQRLASRFSTPTAGMIFRSGR